MKTSTLKHPLAKRPELLQERVHDTYRNLARPKGSLVCNGCGAVFEAGRWRWGDAPANAHRGTCPACRRIEDNYPAGVVEIGGATLDEVTAIARNTETRERPEHPLERIIVIQERDGHITIDTTGTHLARRIGKALHRALGGDLEIEQPIGEHFVHMHLQLDA
jgi:hypothetical protein